MEIPSKGFYRIESEEWGERFKENCPAITRLDLHPHEGNMESADKKGYGYRVDSENRAKSGEVQPKAPFHLPHSYQSGTDEVNGRGAAVHPVAISLLTHRL